jgi:hypothetical protein
MMKSMQNELAKRLRIVPLSKQNQRIREQTEVKNLDHPPT